MGDLHDHMVRGTMGIFVLKILNVVLVFGTTLLLARLLGAKDYGIYAYAVSWASLLSVPGVMGLDTLLVREVARYKTLRNWASLRGILGWSARLVLFSSCGFALSFALGVWFFQGRFESEVRISLWIATALVPLLSFLLLRQGAIWGLGDVVKAQIPQMIVLPSAFLIGAGVLHFTLDLSAASVVGMRAVAVLISVALAFFFLTKNLPQGIQTVSPAYHQRIWLKSALPLLFVGAAGIINLRISTVVVGSLRGAEAAGIFDVAVRGASLVGFVLMAVTIPLAPIIAGLYAKEDMERLQWVVTKSARVALLGSLPIGLGLIFWGRWFLMIFGMKFVKGSTALAILGMGQVVNAGLGSVVTLFNMTGYERDAAEGAGIGVLINVILSALFVTLWGINGAAVATVASFIIWKSLLVMWAYKKMGIQPTVVGRLNKKSK